MASSPVGGDQGSSNDQILKVGAILLKNLIYEEACRHGDDNTVVTRQQLGVEEITDPDIKKIAHRVRQFGDELDGEFQRMINPQSLILSKETFLKVAREIFSDGKFNWGRVVALFYLACRLVIKAVKQKIPDFIKTIIGWTMDYLREHVVNWIRDQGGWEGIPSHFRTPTWQGFAVYLAVVLTAILIIRKM